MGNLQVRFLEGWAPAMAPGYSTVGQKRGSGKCLPDSTQKVSRKGVGSTLRLPPPKTVSKQGLTPGEHLPWAPAFWKLPLQDKRILIQSANRELAFPRARGSRAGTDSRSCTKHDGSARFTPRVPTRATLRSPHRGLPARKTPPGLPQSISG